MRGHGVQETPQYPSGYKVGSGIGEGPFSRGPRSSLWIDTCFAPESHPHPHSHPPTMVSAISQPSVNT